jgi:hypothetical protein
VTNLANLRTLDALATRYSRRPSEILGVSDSWLAYQLDLATLLAATVQDESHPMGFFGRVAALAKKGVRKMKIPESGVW